MQATNFMSIVLPLPKRVRRPCLSFSYGATRRAGSKTGHGLDKPRLALVALIKDQRLFPHMSKEQPISYAMLERLAEEG